MDMDKVWENIIAILLAVSGCMARLLYSKGTVNLKRILSELFVSGFAGFMVLLIARALGLSGDWPGLVCGIAGWLGPRALNFIGPLTLNLMQAAAAKALGVNLDDIKKTKGE